MKNLKYRLTFLITSLFLFNSLNAETFRVGKTHMAFLDPDNNSEQTIKLGINESAAIKLPEDKTFLEGIVISMKIPEAVASWTDCVACSVYDNIKPAPSASQIDYSASRKYVSTLPGMLSWILQIPLQKNNSIKTNRYTAKMDTIPDTKDNVLLLRMQPVMKGIPEETLAAQITLSIKPILSDKGQLLLKLESEDQTENCTVFIDDKAVNYSPAENKYFLSDGIHNISVVADSFRNEVRTVMINQAKTTELIITLNSTEPALLINAPEDATVYLDENPCTTIGREFEISEGEHKIKFNLGSYEIVRTITAVKGKTYTANFTLDLQITED